MEFYEGLPFWCIFVLLSIPAVALGVKAKSHKNYALFASLVIIVILYAQNVANLLYFVAFVMFQYGLIVLWLRVKRSEIQHFNHVSLFILLSLVPLLLNRVCPTLGLESPFAFLGVSYVIFKVIQILIEINDGTIDAIDFKDYLLFMIFFPTLSSGPIDRSRRFLRDVDKTSTKHEYLNGLGKGISCILQGLTYKVIFSQLCFDQMTSVCDGSNTILNLILYAYLYGFYLFFDFAGYSLMAIGAAKIFGIDTPINFNKPFLARDMKDFWNRWHMTLSQWLRDFVFSRVAFRFFKFKTFSNAQTTAIASYLITMFTMGAWHGINASYILYGLYHGVILGVTECAQKTSFYKAQKSKKLFVVISTLLTFHLVMFGFFIFSGKFIELVEMYGGRW